MVAPVHGAASSAAVPPRRGADLVRRLTPREIKLREAI
jgi:hypothetical protein